MNTESMHAMELDGAALTARGLAAFQFRGAGAPKAPADAILCHCRRVARQAVVQAVAAGAVSFEQVQITTGCSTVCGGCRPKVEAVLAAATWRAEAIAEPRQQAFDAKETIDCDAGARLFREDLAEQQPETIAPSLRSRVAAVANAIVMAGVAVLFLACLIGVFAVPLAWAWGAIGAATAIACGLIISIVLAIDARISYGEWRRIFFVETSDDAVLQRGAKGPSLFRRAEAPGTLRTADIRGIVMQRLSFRQWTFYKFTLRLDYLLNDMWRAAAHGVRKSLLRRGFRFARTWSPLYQPCWEHVDRQLAELLIETSLMLGLNETWTDPQSGHTHGRFVYTDWTCPAGPRFKNEAVHIDRFEVAVDLDRRVALSAAVNGREIGAGEDALVLADLCVSVNFHTILHAYANWACVPDHSDPLLAKAAVYTMAMNGQAWEAGYFSNTVATNFRRVLETNAKRGIFEHGNGQLMRQLVRFSRTGAFIIAARNATMDVLREHNVDIDAEAFFLMSVLHSIDHHVIAAAVDPINLHSKLLGYGGMEWIRVLFQEPLRPLFANTRISAQKSGWIADLYKRLCAIDPWYADRVDYCIRY